MTRIIGGVAKGRTIATPTGVATRPTADRVREALFSSLDSLLGTVYGTAFLDVYAGSGAVGLEAASRGACRVLAVERNRAAATLVVQNARALGLNQVQVLAISASALGAHPGEEAFDVAFLDPPYDLASPALAAVVGRLGAGGWLRPGALVVVERGRHGEALTWPDGIDPLRDRRYGDTILWYGRWQPSALAQQVAHDEAEES